MCVYVCSCNYIFYTTAAAETMHLCMEPKGRASLRIYPSKPPSVAEVKVRNIVPSGLM